MKLGLILPRRGPSALWAAGCEAAAALAVAEANATGGVAGVEVSLAVACAGDSARTAAEAAGALRAAGVDAVIGFQPSHMRRAVRDRLGGAVPYFYTPQYEGGQVGPATLALGITDADALGPALAWLAGARRVGRGFFVGNDYVWPRAAHGTAHDAMARSGIRAVGAAILPFGTEEYGPVLSAIRAARPDLVITVLLGEEAVRFHRAFAEAGLAATTLRLALATDETLLMGIGPEAAENLFAADSFFAGVPDPAREAMTALYDLAYGRSRPPVNVFSLGCHDAVRLAVRMARTAGAGDAATLLRALPGVRPRRRPVHVAEADGTGFARCATL